MSKVHQLIAIETNSINGETVQTANARDLHEFLKIGKDFTTWIKERIKQYGFVENQDFIVFPEIGENPKGGRPSIEYAISIDMAKELSMVERNEKGKEARQYFIQCEKRANVCTAELDHRQEPMDTRNNSAIYNYTHQKENVMNDNLIQLARVVAEATASATMKACIDVTGYSTTVPSLPTPQRTSASTSAQTDDEYAPVSEAAYATGFADSACRRLIKVAHIPVLSKGLRGLRVHIPTFLKVANDVMREATPPQGNRKRWSHPKLGSFTYRSQI